jgi:tellurite resistance protein TerB
VLERVVQVGAKAQARLIVSGGFQLFFICPKGTERIMGFLSKLFGQATAAKNAVTDEISKLQRQDDVQALLAVTALVAGADGEVSQDERDMLIDFVKNGASFKGFDRTTLATKMEENLKKCTNPIMRDDLLDDIRGIADEPLTSVKVVNAAIAMAGADNNFEPVEREAILEVCDVLGLDPNQFRKLRA